MINDTIDINDLLKEFKNWIKNLRQEEVAKSTIKSYENCINKFFEYLKEEDITEINKITVIDYKDYLLNLRENGFLKTNTINQRIIILNKFLKSVNLNELTVKTLKIQRKTSLDNTITESDYNRLIRWSDKLDMKREKLIMKTLATTGIRISELKYFTVGNLKKSNTIEVYNKGKIRKIIIPDKIKNLLLDYAKQEERQTGIKPNIIFHARNNPNQLLDKAQIWRNLKYIAGKARVRKSKVHAHSFRHLYSKRYLSNGGNVLDLADLLGHSSLETTRIYSQLTSSEQSKIINKTFSEYL